jgi:hypothetical protein
MSNPINRKDFVSSASQAMRHLGAATTLSGLALLALSGTTSAADSPNNVAPDSQVGFVVSHIKYALGKDASETGACPDGMTEG